MDFEGIMLSEIRQTKTNTEISHLYVGFKKQKQKAKLRDTENTVVARSRPGQGGVGEGGQKGQTSS